MQIFQTLIMQGIFSKAGLVVYSLVYSQCYHLSTDVCQRKSSGTSTAPVLLSTEHLPYKYSLPATHTHTHTNSRLIKFRKGEPEKKSRQTVTEQGERQTAKESEAGVVGWWRIEIVY